MNRNSFRLHSVLTRVASDYIRFPVMFKQIEWTQKADHPLATYQWALARVWFFHVDEISKNNSNEVRCDTTVWLNIDLVHEVQPFFRRLSQISSETKSWRYKFFRVCCYLRNDRRIRIIIPLFKLCSATRRGAYFRTKQMVLHSYKISMFSYDSFIFFTFWRGSDIEGNPESFETTGVSDNATQNIGKKKVSITST